jgi:hypothetical protein
MNLLVIIFARPTSARACSCVKPGLPDQEFQKSNAVFTGKVLGIVDEYVPVYSMLDRILVAMGEPAYFWPRAGRYVGYRVHFLVQNSWKGVEQKTVLVDTGYGMGDCGYPFAVSSDYLVYASHPYGIPDNYWVTSVCSRNAEIYAAGTDLSYLSTLPSLPLRSSLQIFGLPVSTVALWAVFFLTAVVFFAYGQRPQSLRSEG